MSASEKMPKCSSIKLPLNLLLLDGPQKPENKRIIQHHASQMHKVHQDACILVKIIHSLIGQHGWQTHFGAMKDHRGVPLVDCSTEEKFFKFILTPYFYKLVASATVAHNPACRQYESKYGPLSERLRQWWRYYGLGERNAGEESDSDDNDDVDDEEDDSDEDGEDDDSDEDGEDDEDDDDANDNNTGTAGGKGADDGDDSGNPVYTTLKRNSGGFSTQNHLVQLGVDMAKDQLVHIRARFEALLFEFINTAYNKKKVEREVKDDNTLSAQARRLKLKTQRAKLKAVKEYLCVYVDSDPNVLPVAPSPLLNAQDIAFVMEMRRQILPTSQQRVQGPHGRQLIYTVVKTPWNVYPVLIYSSSSSSSPCLPTFLTPLTPSYPRLYTLSHHPLTLYNPLLPSCLRPPTPYHTPTPHPPTSHALHPLHPLHPPHPPQPFPLSHPV